jgi:transposase
MNDAILAGRRACQNARPIRVMFMDEARFGRISDPHRCWAPAGLRPTVPCQVVREFTYSYAAVCPFDGHLDTLILPEVNTPTMSFYLDYVSRRHPDEHVVIIMDQAGWHKARKLRIPRNITLHWLPPYSPELNPVEHLWQHIRKSAFHNRVFHSLDAVEDALEAALASLLHNPSTVRSLTLFSWITIA